jgi:hypothetical protein
VARPFTSVAAVALAVLSIVNIVLAVAATSWQIGTDFRLPYAAAEVGLRDGWSHMYDPAVQRAAVLALGHSDLYQPYINLPPWAFLVAPLTLIPYPVAYGIWVALMVACLVSAALLAAHPIACSGSSTWARRSATSRWRWGPASARHRHWAPWLSSAAGGC